MSEMSGSGNGIADLLTQWSRDVFLKEVVMVVQAELGSEAVEVLIRPCSRILIRPSAEASPLGQDHCDSGLQPWHAKV